VSLMIGANDFFLRQKTTADGCASTAEQAATPSRIATNVRRTLSSIRGEAHCRGQLAIVDYYSLNYSVPATNALAQALNTTMAKAARGLHVITADGFGVWRAASVHSALNPCTAGLLTQLGSPGACGIHPSYAGQALLAEALQRAIRT
jgi:lysophospholipase L1-like esterase